MRVTIESCISIFLNKVTIISKMESICVFFTLTNGGIIIADIFYLVFRAITIAYLWWIWLKEKFSLLIIWIIMRIIISFWKSCLVSWYSFLTLPYFHKIQFIDNLNYDEDNHIFLKKLSSLLVFLSHSSIFSQNLVYW